MCLVGVAADAHPHYALVIAANRDEFHERGAVPAHWWDAHPQLYGGRDAREGGAWFALHRAGRFALVTNIRRPGSSTGRSRGQLVLETVLSGALPPPALARSYRPFNLLLGQGPRLHYTHSDAAAGSTTRASVYALSNAPLGIEWPKTRALSAALARWSMEAQPLAEIWPLLRDERPAADAELPDTGVGLAMERFLSPIFIRSEHYGTRSSAVLAIDHAGHWHFEERYFDAAAQVIDTRQVAFHPAYA